MPNAREQYRGPYAHRAPRVLIRISDVSTLTVTFEIMSTFYPVAVDFGDGSSGVFADGDTNIQHTYGSADTRTVTATCPRGATSSVSSTVS